MDRIEITNKGTLYLGGQQHGFPPGSVVPLRADHAAVLIAEGHVTPAHHETPVTADVLAAAGLTPEALAREGLTAEGLAKAGLTAEELMKNSTPDAATRVALTA
jgi:hypothetical protein